MAFFDSDGVSIHYEVFGQGRPIVLVHGYASNLQQNWIAPGWIDALTPLRQVIALDCRGHGESSQAGDPTAYGDVAMGGDVIRLMDHLGIETAGLFGYSIGARICLGLAASLPKRFTSAVLGGFGGGLARHRTGGKDYAIVDALLTRVRANGAEPAVTEQLGRVSMPVLIVNGANDGPVGDPRPIADALPNARVVLVPDRDHFSVVSDMRFKTAVVEFLKSVSDTGAVLSRMREA
jgi:pimeloyl-ACP methyl ester carboxylesterase